MRRLAVEVEGDIRQILEYEIRAGEVSARNAMGRIAEEVQTELRGQVLRAGMGRRLANTWRSRVFPERGVSLNSAAFIWTRAPEIIKAHSEGATIRAQDGKWLAIPTDAAPKKGTDGKRLTPANFPEDRFGELRMVRRKRRSALLVVDGVRINKSGKASRQLKETRTKSGKLRKGVATVPMFTLVRQTRIDAKLEPDKAFKRGQARLPGVWQSEFKDASNRIARGNTPARRR